MFICQEKQGVGKTQIGLCPSNAHANPQQMFWRLLYVTFAKPTHTTENSQPAPGGLFLGIDLYPHQDLCQGPWCQVSVTQDSHCSARVFRGNNNKTPNQSPNVCLLLRMGLPADQFRDLVVRSLSEPRDKCCAARRLSRKHLLAMWVCP